MAANETDPGGGTAPAAPESKEEVAGSTMRQQEQERAQAADERDLNASSSEGGQEATPNLSAPSSESKGHKQKSGMDVMMSLEGEALNELRDIFKAKEDGLNQREFIATLLERLEHTKAEEELLVADLVDLFAEIDINGDGTMDWDEFTKFCVESGLVATRHVKLPLRYHYVEDMKYTDVTSHGPFVHRLKFFEEIQMLVVCEAESNTVKIYSRNMELWYKLDAGVPSLEEQMRQKKGKRKKKQRKTLAEKEEEMDNAVALDVAFIPKYNILAVLSNNLSITLWDISPSKFDPNAKPEEISDRRYRYCGNIFTKVMQTTICWSESADRLFTSGDASGIIRAWQLTAKQKSRSSRNKRSETVTYLGLLDKELDGHRGVIMDCLDVPRHQMIASCGLDRRILLWDNQEFNVKGELLGHTRGVRQLAYADDQDILLSCGFEFDALGWDIHSRQLILRLRGHRAPVVGISIVRFQPLYRAITTDIKGCFKVWDIAKNMKGEAYTMQTFQTASVLGKFNPRGFVVPNSTRMVIAGGCKMRRFKCIKLKQMEDPPVAALFNPTSLSFAVAMGRSVQIFSATTGKIINAFNQISDSEITGMCLDDRQRKLILSNQSGETKVYSFQHGLLMKEFSTHGKEVKSLIYCNEDKCVITAAGDLSVRIHDEIEPDSGPVLRAMENVHKRDISCCTFSHELALIATGSADFSVRIIDFQHAKLEPMGVCQFHQSEIVTLQFVPKRPLLISGDCSGVACVWAVRPSKYRYSRPLHVFQNLSPMKENEYFGQLPGLMSSPKAGEEHSFFFTSGTGGELRAAPATVKKRAFMACVPLTNMVVSMEVPGRKLLITGDESGDIKVWDFSACLSRLEATHGLVELAEDEMPCNTQNYNPRRRIHRDLSVMNGQEGVLTPKASTPKMLKRSSSSTSVLSQGSSSPTRKSRRRSTMRRKSLLSNIITDGQMTGAFQSFDMAGRIMFDGVPKSPLQRALKDSPEDVKEIARWTAHSESLRTLEYIPEPESILSCSFDMSVRIWNLKGEQIGCLSMSEKDRDLTAMGALARVPYRFRIDVEMREGRLAQQARGILNDLKAWRQNLDEKEKEEHEEERIRLAHKLHAQEHDAEILSRAPSPDIEGSEVVLEDLLLVHGKDAGGVLPLEAEHDQMRRSLLMQIWPEHREGGDHLEATHDEDQDDDRISLDFVLKDRAGGNQITGAGDDNNESGAILEEESEKFDLTSTYTNFVTERDRRLTEASTALERKATSIEPSAFLVAKLGLDKKDTKLKMSSSVSLKKSKRRSRAKKLQRSSEQSQSVVHIEPINGPSTSSGVAKSSSMPALVTRPMLGPGLQGHAKGTKTKTKKSARVRLGHRFLAELDALSAHEHAEEEKDEAERGTSHVRSTTSIKARMRTHHANMAKRSQIYGDALGEDLASQKKTVAGKNLTSAIKKKKRVSLKRGSQKSVHFEEKEAAQHDTDAHVRKKSLKRTGSSLVFGRYTAKEVLQLKSMFEMFDEDGSGAIDLEEFQSSAMMQESHLFSNTGGMFESIDVDNDGTITLEELMQVAFPFASKKEIKQMQAWLNRKKEMHRKKSQELTQAQLDELQAIFHLFDKDGNGSLSLDEMKEATLHNHSILQEEDIEALCVEYDLDGSQALEIDEFIMLLKDEYTSGAASGKAKRRKSLADLQAGITTSGRNLFEV